MEMAFLLPLLHSLPNTLMNQCLRLALAEADYQIAPLAKSKLRYLEDYSMRTVWGVLGASRYFSTQGSGHEHAFHQP